MAQTHELVATARSFLQAGRTADAEAVCRSLIARAPDMPEPWELLAEMACGAGQFENALALFARAASLAPPGVEAICNTATALQKLGRLDEAVAHFQRAIALDARMPEAHYNLGNALRRQGRPDDAIACYRAAVALRSEFIDALLNLGAVLSEQGQAEEAAACYRRVLGLQPHSAEAHDGLGTVCLTQDRTDEAVEHYRQSLARNPASAQVWNNLGFALTRREDLAEAARCLERSLQLSPAFAAAWNNLGNVRGEAGSLAEAIDCYTKAIALSPRYPEAWRNLGMAHLAGGRFDQAEACYRRALDMDPNGADYHFALATLWLLRGDFAAGWREYEWRTRANGRQPPPDRHRPWNGEPLAGKRILLQAEQGIGDTLQFIRYAPRLQRDFGARVLLECPANLRAILKGFPGVDEFVDVDEAVEADYSALLLSLPRILATTLSSIPAETAYLRADPVLVADWNQRLAALNGFRVGINWSGRRARGTPRDRNIPLDQFGALAAIPGVSLVNLQKGADRGELLAARESFALFEPGEDVDTTRGALVDTAAIMMNLDLVVTSDTSIAHLAGALGVPVWVALPFVPEWRWLLDRDDSPWYPTMRLFRQDQPGDWTAVFQRLRNALAALMVARPAGTCDG